jgi:hypothetical protein
MIRLLKDATVAVALSCVFLYSLALVTLGATP